MAPKPRPPATIARKLKVANRKVRRGWRSLNQNVKTGVVIGLTLASGFGTYRVIESKSAKALDKTLNDRLSKNESVKNGLRTTRDGDFLYDEISAYNKKARIDRLYFTDADRIIEVNLNVIKLERIRQLLPQTERQEITKIIIGRVNRIKAAIKENKVLAKKVKDRVGNENDIERYILSLPMDKLKNIFTPQELEAIIKQLNNMNPNIVKEIKKLTTNNENNALTGAGIAALMVSAVLSGLLIRKKEN